MLVKFVGHDSLIMTDYNGGRIVLEKNKPKEISKEVYDYIIQSDMIDLKDLLIIHPEPIDQEKEPEEIHKKRKAKK